MQGLGVACLNDEVKPQSILFPSSVHVMDCLSRYRLFTKQKQKSEQKTHKEANAFPLEGVIEQLRLFTILLYILPPLNMS